MATELDDETLQRYYDGDLSPVEERIVRARVETEPQAQKRLEQLARLSELMRLGAEEMASEVDSEALFAGIDAQIQKEKELGVGQRLRLVAGEWLEHRRNVASLVAVTAVAAAAVIMLVARDTHDPGLARTPHKREQVRIAETAPPRVQGSHVENVDFGQSTGTVFEIESQGVSMAVVWIADEEETAP